MLNTTNFSQFTSDLPTTSKVKTAAQLRVSTQDSIAEQSNINVDKKDLYEYTVQNNKQDTPGSMKVISFRKYGFGGVGNFHTYVT
jgi:hypothetical protein